MAKTCTECAKAGRGAYKNTAVLMRAARCGHYECLKWSVHTGVDVNAVNPYSTSDGSVRNTALILAAKGGHHKCVELLLKNGADVNKANSRGTALIEVTEKGHERCVELLLKAGARVNLSGAGGYTALIRAAENGHFGVLDYLLKSAANVNESSFSNGTALMHAAKNGHHKCVELLIDSGAAVEKTPNSIDSALTEAATHEKCLELIIKTGTKHASITGPYGSRALLQAAKLGRDRCIEMLLDAKVNKDEVIRAGIKGNKETQRTLNKALLEVANSGRSVRLLINAGADVNYRDKSHGHTALILAAKNQWLDQIQVLLEEGACMSARDFHGDTPVLAAVRTGNVKCIQLLLSSELFVEAYVNVNDYEGNAPLSVAVKNRAVECVQLLLEKGALVNSSQIKGKSLLKYHMTSRLESSKKLCMLLFAAGETIDFYQFECIRSASVRNYKYIRGLTKSELSLKGICRQAIRKHLLNVNPRINLFVRIHTLELPWTLPGYLLYNVSLDSQTVMESDDHHGDDSDDHSDDYSGDSSDSDRAFYFRAGLNSDEESIDSSDTTENTNNNGHDDSNTAAAIGVSSHGENADDDNDDLADEEYDYVGPDDENADDDLDDGEESNYDYGDDDENDYGEQDYDDVQFDGDDEYY